MKAKKRIKLSKNIKSSIFVLLVAMLAFLLFDPLFTVLGQNSGQEFAAAIFGTIVAAVITMVLLTKQSETEEEKSRNGKVFEQKILLYNQALDTLQQIFEKTENGQIKISQKEIVQIEFLLAKMMMIGSDKTINEFKTFYQMITANYSARSEEVIISASDRQVLFRFADYCREEFGLSDKNMEKEVLEDIVLQGELFGNLEKMGNLPPETVDNIKDIYGYLVFELNLDSRHIKFTPDGFEAYSSHKRAEKSMFLICNIDKDSVYVALNTPYKGKDFESTLIDNQPVLTLRATDRQKVDTHFDKIERLIKNSYQQSKTN